EATDHARRPTWASRAIPEARGDFRVLPDGRRAAIRYKGWTTRDFGAFRTYTYDDARPEPAVERAPAPAGSTGDPARGRALFLDRAKGPCAGCHLVPGDDVWPAGCGDHLDPTNNPAILLAEDAQARWGEKGPAGRACADCHAGGPAQAMRSVATRYPRHVRAFGRVMSLEDFLEAHGQETTGRPYPAESEDNLTMTMLVKMAGNGLPVAIDTSSPEA